LPDPLVLVPDPRFGGGGQAMIDAFVDGARALGRDPTTVSPGYVRGVDSLNQLWAGRRLAGEAHRAKSLWVVAAAASYGAAAAHADRPYACWIATSLEEEWPARLGALSRGRRLAHAANAPLLRRVERRVLVGASSVFGISPVSRDSLARAGRRSDVGILPIPVDTEHFMPEPDDLWRSRLEHPTVGFVGRGDDPRKNVRLLLDAWPLVRQAVPDAQLVLMGRRPLGALPAGVEARGEVSDVAAELRTCVLFVLPSLQEAFGIVAAEALACGVPVVSTPCGGPEDLIARSHGGRVAAGFEPEQLAETVASLLADAPQLLAMRQAGRAYVEVEHSPSRFRAQLAQLLR
jgi:glycosyltransferase involved in cell wall biosynthesis